MQSGLYRSASLFFSTALHYEGVGKETIVRVSVAVLRVASRQAKL